MSLSKHAIKVGDKVYRTLRCKPFDVIAIVDGKVHIKCDLEQRWVKLTSMAYSYTIVGTSEDLELRAAFKRNGWPVWEEDNG